MAHNFKPGDTCYFHFPDDTLSYCHKGTVVTVEDIYGYDGNNCTLVWHRRRPSLGLPKAADIVYLRMNTAALSTQYYEPTVRLE